MRTSVILSLLVIAFGATHALAVPGDLQCFKVTNQTLKGLKAVVDLDAPSTGAAPGCKLTKAKLYCVPAETTARAGTLLDGKRPVTPVPFVGLPTEGAQLCYGVKCKKPAGVAPDRSVTDQFGQHQLAKLQTSMLCKPVVPTSVQIKSPDIEVQPFQEVAYCYYFRASTNDTFAIKRWTSHLPASARKVVVVFSNTDLAAPGTQTAANCRVFRDENASDFPEWVYSADQPDAAFDFPADDGTGKPVGLVLKPGQSGYLYIHYHNTTDAPVTDHVEVNADLYDFGTPVTRADSFITYNAAISIPAASAKSQSLTCQVPPGAQLFSLSTYSRKQSVHTFLKDGADNSILFESTSFAHPGELHVNTPPFLSPNQLTYQCDYVNPTNRTITSGDSLATDELCMGITFFFPSTKPRVCYNNFLL